MKLTDKQAQFYIGCGITKDSQPDLEFAETAHKSQTMKQVLAY